MAEKLAISTDIYNNEEAKISHQYLPCPIFNNTAMFDYM
jgi:hypothetical protein